MDVGPDFSVLLLDDDNLVSWGMRECIQLSEPRAVVTEATSYGSAVAALDAGGIDIAFLDIDLKGERSGLDVLKHIRATQLSTRAIMLSANVDDGIVMECIKLGASGYIPKNSPSRDVFRRALDTIFQGGIFLPAEAIGKGGYSPQPASPASSQSLEELGVRGRALEALYYICQGYSNQLIAYKMGVAESTVANDYNTKLFKLFRVTNRASLIVEVSRRGIIPPTPSREQS